MDCTLSYSMDYAVMVSHLGFFFLTCIHKDYTFTWPPSFARHCCQVYVADAGWHDDGAQHCISRVSSVCHSRHLQV